MRSFLGLSTFLLATAGMVGQTTHIETAPALASSQATVVDIQGRNCPVTLAASRSGGGGLIQVQPGSVPRGQELSVYLQPTSAQGIVQVQFTLRGAAGPHVAPAGNGSSAEISEDFTVVPRGEKNMRFTSVVYPTKLKSVSYVELNAITYANGTQWHRSASSVCRVVPNGFKLVAAEGH